MMRVVEKGIHERSRDLSMVLDHNGSPEERLEMRTKGVAHKCTAGEVDLGEVVRNPVENVRDVGDGGRAGHSCLC